MSKMAPGRVATLLLYLTHRHKWLQTLITSVTWRSPLCSMVNLQQQTEVGEQQNPLHILPRNNPLLRSFTRQISLSLTQTCLQTTQLY